MAAAARRSASTSRWCGWCGGISSALTGLRGSSAFLVDGLRQTLSEIWRAKCTYCIGLTSCMLTVIVAAVVQTLLARAPLIFLREAEAGAGQIDITLYPDPYSGATFMNWTELHAALAAGPNPASYAYHSPRHTIPVDAAWPAAACSASAPAGWTAQPLTLSNAWMYAGAVRNAGGLEGSNYGGRVVCGTASCLRCTRGTGVASLTLLLIDSQREAAAGIGRAWSLGRIPEGHVVLHSAVAAALRVGVDSTLVLQSGWFSGIVRHALAPAPTTPGWLSSNVSSGSSATGSVPGGLPLRDGSGWPERALQYGADVAMPVVVWAVVPSLLGKADGGLTSVILMEFDSFLPSLAAALHPSISMPAVFVPDAHNGTFTAAAGAAASASNGTATLRVVTDVSGEVLAVNTLARASLQSMQQQDSSTGSAADGGAAAATAGSRLYDFAGSVVACLPPSARVTIYGNSNYDRVRAGVADFASSMLYVAGFSETDPSLPLLSALESRRFLTLYLGLVLDALLIILFALSTLLIYSLLLVNAEGRTFELAVRRMLGTRREGVVYLLMAQAAAYGVPAWVVGLVVAQILAAWLLTAFGKLATLPIPATLSSDGILAATVLATLIPAVAAIGPIRGALRSSIRSALDADRPKATAVVYSLERSGDGSVGAPYVIVGLGTFLFGFGIYYLVPLALLSLNLALFFNLFLAVLIGLLAGLVLLALNLELPLLRGLSMLCVQWWERPAIFRLLWANISAGHRPRNRKTVIMYAISIAFIVFIAVAAEAQIQSAVYSAQQTAGAPLVLSPPYYTWSLASTSNALAAGTSSPSVPDPLVIAMIEGLARYSTRGSSRPGAGGGGGSGGIGAQNPWAAVLPWAWAGVAPPASATDVAAAAASFAAFAPLPAADLLPSAGSPGAASLLAGTAWATRRMEEVGRWVANAGSSAWIYGYNFSIPLRDSNNSTGASTAAAAAAGGVGVITGGSPSPMPAVYLNSIGVENIGGIDTWTVVLRGVSPSMYSSASSASGPATYSQFLLAGDAQPSTQTTLQVDEQLYTVRGSQGAALGTNMQSNLYLAQAGPFVLQTSAATQANIVAVAAASSDGSGGASSADASAGGLPRSTSTLLTATALLSSAPWFVFSRAPSSAANAGIASIPALTRMVDEHARSGGVPRVPVAVAVGAFLRASTTAVLSALSNATVLGNETIASAAPTAATLAALPVGVLASLSSASFSDIMAACPSAASSHPLLIRLAALALLRGSSAAAAAGDAEAVASGAGGNLDVAAAAGGGGSVTFSLFGFGAGSVASRAASAPSGPLGLAHLTTGVSVEDVPLEVLFQGFGSASPSDATVNAYTAAVNVALTWAAQLRNGDRYATYSDTGWSLADTRAGADSLAATISLLEVLFAALALVAMVLCFFSLSASMVTNITEQTREIGVLRALGLKPAHLIRVYVHEAFLIVLASSLLGTAIGNITAWTFGQQQTLFTSIPVPFVVPWSILIVVVGASAVCAVLAAWLPARRLLQRRITALLRAAA